MGDVVMNGDTDWRSIRGHLKDLRRGTHLSFPEVTFHRAKFVETTGRRGAYLDLDGEPVGRDPTRFEVLPGALDLLV